MVHFATLSKDFSLKKCKFGNMPPPCIAGVAGAVVTPLQVSVEHITLMEAKGAFLAFMMVSKCEDVVEVPDKFWDLVLC